MKLNPFKKKTKSKNKKKKTKKEKREEKVAKEIDSYYDSEYKFKIQRNTPSEKKGWVGTISGVELADYPGSIEEYLQEHYGGGGYSVTVQKDGKTKDTHSVKIAGPPKGKSSEMNSIEKFLKEQREDRLQGRIDELERKLGEKKQGPDWTEILKVAPEAMTGFASFLKQMNNQGIEMKDLLQMFSQQQSGQGGGLDLSGISNLMQTAFQMGQAGNGDKSENLLGQILGMVQSNMGQQQAGPQTQQLEAGPQPAEQTQPQAQAQQSPMNQQSQMIGQFIARLVDQYDTPEKVVDGIKDNLDIQSPDDAIPAIQKTISRFKGEDFSKQVADGLRERHSDDSEQISPKENTENNQTPERG